ncbi:Acid phosphatase/vanadium-dependent haloperoxidase protein [Zea mays]|uniref:Acid phosphatase/vanadium-dependent haloperoxidase protein n=1 Tax=Zea mays TaxID=4577 RepID=A0A1D6LEU0_MAIZE|nr:Acid phosphatase/vanadium-dependent haloperoxidase protein [Zea mays]
MAESIVSGAAAPPPGAPSFSYLAVFSNCPLVAAVLAFAIAQSIKVLTTWYKENRWDAKQLVGSGGMPSSHSATVTALAVAVGLQEGFASSLFATTAVFASVVTSLSFKYGPQSWKVMYDAFGVRLHAGKQAEVLNQIVYELPSEHPLAETRPLRELLGHTPPQVFAGGVLGFAVATFTAMIAGLGS